MKKTILTYEAAYAELQVILNELQSESISIDDLTAKVARATELIEYCRSRLRSTEQEVQKLVS